MSSLNGMHRRSDFRRAGLGLRAVGALALVGVLTTVPTAQAQQRWTGAIDNRWAEAGNWAPTGTPNGSIDIVFGAVAGSNPTTIQQSGADAAFRNLTHTGAHDYTVNLGSNAYMVSGDITMTGAEGNGNLSLPYSGSVRLGKSTGGSIINNSAGAFTAESIWYQGGGAASRVLTFATGIPAATITTKNFQKRYAENKVDLLKSGPGTLIITAAASNFYTSQTGEGIGGLTGKVTVTGGTLRITSGNEDSLGRYNARLGDFAPDVLTLDGGRLQVAEKSLTIDDYNRGITLGPNGGGFDVDAGWTLTIGSDNVITGPGALLKTGTGTLTLQAGNTYAGTTTVAAGLLSVTGALADNGPDHVLIHSAGTAFGANDPRLARAVAGGSSLAMGSAIVGGQATTAEILAGTAGQNRTLTMAWRGPAPGDRTATGLALSSDVLKLDGTASDTYVLQLSFPVESHGHLVWLDDRAGSGSLGQWIPAVAGNTGAVGSLAVADYDGSWAAFIAGLDTGWTLSDVLGSYGVDAAGSVAWAVLDHAGQFAVVVPEPATWLLLLSALAGGLLIRRR